MKVGFRVGVVVLAFSLSGWTQQDFVRRVQGEILPDHGPLPSDLTVEVYDLNRHIRVDRAMVLPNGNFEFRDLGAGQYWIQIVNSSGDVIHQELAAINRNREPLFVRIHAGALTRPETGTVSARSLRHIPRKAAREFRRSQKALIEGRIRESKEHLEKAIEICPDYMEAHTNLGVRLMSFAQYDKAAEEFQKTVALDPASGRGYVNLSAALAVLGRYSEAEIAARRALQLDSHSLPARYELGQLLAAQGKDLPQALEHLRKAAERYPKSYLVIARILVRQGAVRQAAVELRQYLRSGDAEKRWEAESWLAQLSQ